MTKIWKNKDWEISLTWIVFDWDKGIVWQALHLILIGHWYLNDTLYLYLGFYDYLDIDYNFTAFKITVWWEN